VVEILVAFSDWADNPPQPFVINSAIDPDVETPPAVKVITQRLTLLRRFIKQRTILKLPLLST
jgi:hypothetical protein